MTQQSPFKSRHFEAKIVLLCIRWYLRFSLSYRDLEVMMAERGLSVDHTTIYRYAGRCRGSSAVPQVEPRAGPGA